MIRAFRLTAAAATVMAGLLVARTAGAQVMCNDATLLPNPTIVTGSNTVEPMVGQFAVKLAAEPTPVSVLFATSAATSCAGISSVVDGADLGGSPGRYYTLSGTSVVRNDCTFAAGQKAHVAVSDVFYESCSKLPQPRPADVADVTGPVQATVFIVPPTDTTTQYLTYQEAQTIYGCGVSSVRPVAGFVDPMGVFCRAPEAGSQMVLAKSLGLAPTAPTSPTCINGGGSPAAMAGNVLSYGARSLGFITTDGLEGLRSSDSNKIKPLAFQSPGQAQAYAVDSGPDFPDRRNVRDGHYTIWGYEHLIAKSSGGALGKQAAEFIAWVTGAKSSANVDYALLEAGAGLIPQCAMRVKRSSDGGSLSPYAPSEPCACVLQALLSRTVPPGCQVCVADQTCSGGLRCRHGFCE